jgi:hypothetical protein
VRGLGRALFSAIYGTDPLIFRRNLSTKNCDSLQIYVLS